MQSSTTMFCKLSSTLLSPKLISSQILLTSKVFKGDIPLLVQNNEKFCLYRTLNVKVTLFPENLIETILFRQLKGIVYIFIVYLCVNSFYTNNKRMGQPWFSSEYSTYISNIPDSNPTIDSNPKAFFPNIFF